MASPNFDAELNALEASMACLGVSNPQSRSNARKQKMTTRSQTAAAAAPRMCTVCLNLFEGEAELVDHLLQFHRASRKEIKDQYQHSKKVLEVKRSTGQNTQIAERNFRINTLRLASLEKISPEGWSKLRQ